MSSPKADRHAGLAGSQHGESLAGQRRRAGAVEGERHERPRAVPADDVGTELADELALGDGRATSPEQLVLPVGIITSLIRGDVYNWGQIMTGALLGAAPPLIIYAFLMDYYIAGLTAGATKG